MTWVRLDDGFAEHPKILDLSDRAFRVHVAALCYSARHLTDGRISTSAAKKLGTNRKITAELERSGLWTTEDGFALIHDFNLYQPTRAQVLEERRKQAERKRRSRGESRQESRGESRVDTTLDNGAMSRRDSGGSHASPTRPLPDLTPLGSEVKEQLEAVPRGLATAQESESQEEGFPL